MTDIVSLNLDPDLDRALKSLNSLKRQAPFIATVAINRVADVVSKQAWPRYLKRNIDRPRPFTLKPLYVSRADRRKRPVTARVGIRRIQQRYLRPLLEGGRRSDKPD